MKRNRFGKSKRFLSFFLVVVMMLGLLPQTALDALAQENKVRVIVENTTYTTETAEANGWEAPIWEGTLVDTWVAIDETSTMMSSLLAALESAGATQQGAEYNYITEINGLAAGNPSYEAGWMGSLNDWFVNAGFGDFTVAAGTLEAGDEIRIMFSCSEMGADLGAAWNENYITTLDKIVFSAGTLDQEFSPAQANYVLTVSEETKSLLVTPTATDKNFLVKTFVGTGDAKTEYKRTAEIPVTDGMVIEVECGNPEWPSSYGWQGANNWTSTVYTFEVKVDKPVKVNSIPARKAGVEATAIAKATYDTPWILDLSTIFEDADGDTLTYSVAVDGAAAEAADVNYSYTPADMAEHTFVFTANDGEADSTDTYTVTLNTEKRAAKLASLIVHTSSSPSNSNVLLENSSDTYTTTNVFQADTLNYTLANVTDTSNQLRFRAAAASSDDKVTLVYGEQTKDITWISGSSKWANCLSGGRNTLQIKVESKAGDENVTPTIYTLVIDSLPTLTALRASNDSVQYYLDKTFAAATTEYTLTVPKSQSEITVEAAPKSADYTVTYNGADSATVDISSADKIDVVVKAGEVTNTYTINLNKVDALNFKPAATPADAVIKVYDQAGAAVKPNNDGSYSGMFGAYDYTYTVTRYGYVGQSGTVPAEGGQLTVNLVKAEADNLRDVSVYWPNFRGNDNNMAITSVKLPLDTDATRTSLLWNKQFGTGWSDAPSVQIIVDDSLVAMANKKIYKLDLQTGEIEAEGDMVAAPSYGFTPPIYAEGMIFCPLGSGQIQAFNAETLESVWVYKDNLGGQSLAPIAYSDGYLYTGFWNGEVKNANYVCLSVTDEDPASTNESKLATWKHTQLGGFYWAGAVVVGDAVIVGTDNGVSAADGTGSVYSFNKYTGEVISKLNVTGDQRSSMAYDAATGRIYFTTKAGYLYRMNVNAATGELSNLVGKDHNAQTTSTPVVYKGRVYFGTGSGISSTGSSGNFVVADAENLEMIAAVGMKGYPQCSMLMTNAYETSDGCLYFYSTYNANPGGISVIKVKADCDDNSDVTLTELYEAGGFEQFCISSVICGSDGTLYYKNDSKNVLAVGIVSASKVVNLINQIGTVTLESGTAITAARESYDAIPTAEEKAYVSNYEVLTEAEKVYAELVKADAVDAKIAAIGTVDLTSGSKIEEARKAYDALTEEEQARVTKADVLTAAEAAYKKLTATASEEVEKLIEAIGTVTIYSEDDIEAARKAYDALTADAKKQVTNVNVLINAEKALEDAKVEQVEKLIDAIGNVTLSSKSAISRARTAYNKLSTENKKKVDNVAVLRAAEDAYELLVDEQLAAKAAAAATTATTVKKTTTVKTERTEEEELILSVEELIDALNKNSSDADLLAAMEAFESLSLVEQAMVTNADELEDVKEDFAVRNQRDPATGIAVSGCDWNIRLVVEPLDEIATELAKAELAGKAKDQSLLSAWNIYLEDITTGEKYEPTEPVVVMIPIVEIENFTAYDGLVAVHYRADGTMEYLNCVVVGTNLAIQTSEFSRYAVLGYHGDSPLLADVTETAETDLAWLPWTISGALGVAILVLLAVMLKKNGRKEVE